MLRQLTPHVFVMKHNHDTDRPALGLIAGKTASLVVDGGNSPAHARAFLQGISALGVAAPRYLALTHWHWDHVFGAPEMGLTTLANRRTQPHSSFPSRSPKSSSERASTASRTCNLRAWSSGESEFATMCSRTVFSRMASTDSPSADTAA